MAAGDAIWPVVDGYEITSEIGRGGFASVYEAVQESVGRRVALKVLSTAATGPGMERRFRSECRTIGELSWHPHVVALFDAGLSADGRPYMAMEYLPAGSLAERVKADGPLGVDDAIRVGTEIADALSAAHEAGVIHRDVKPANILIGRRGEYLLSDFGIATITDATQSTTGTFSGTYAYSAPEIHKGLRASPASDVFSLAASLYMLISGRSPFMARTDDAPSAVILRVVSEPPPPLPPSVSPELAAVIDAGLAKEPAHRPQSAAEFRDALRSLDRPTGAQEPSGPAPGDSSETLPVSDAGDPDTGSRDADVGPVAAQLGGEVVAQPGDDPTVRRAAVLSSAEQPSEAEPPSDGRVSGSGNRTRSRWVLVTSAVVAASLLLGGFVLARSQSTAPDDTSARNGDAGSSTTSNSATPSESVAEFVPSVTATVDVGANPAGVASDDTAIWVTNNDDNSVSRIDPATNTVTATIEVGAKPSGIAAGDSAIWVANTDEVTNSDGGSVSRIDPATNTVTATIDISGGPSGVAAGENAIWVSRTNAGSVSRIDPTTNTVTATIDVGGRPSGVAVGSNAVWVANPLLGIVSRIDPATNTVTATIDIGVDGAPNWVAASADAVWVTNDRFGFTVSRIDPTTNTVTATIDVGAAPWMIAVGSDGLWVTTANSDTVLVVDPATNTVTEAVDVGYVSWAVAVDETAVWVTNPFDGKVSRVQP